MSQSDIAFETDKLLLKHLDIVQDVIKRQAQNSFVVKGWAVTLVSIIFALVRTQGATHNSYLIALLPTVLFWYLDAYYLRQERLFRHLFNSISQDLLHNTTRVSPLSMDTSVYKRDCKLRHAITSNVVLPIYVFIGLTAIGLQQFN